MLFVLYSLLVSMSRCSAGVEEKSVWIRNQRELGSPKREVHSMRAVACREFADAMSTNSLAPEAATSTDLYNLDISRSGDTVKSTEGTLMNNENIEMKTRPLCSYVFLRNIGKHTPTATEPETITATPPTAGRDGIALHQGRHGDDVRVTGPHVERDSYVSGINDKKGQNKRGRKVTLGLEYLRKVLKITNVLDRKRRETAESSANDVTVRRSVSVRQSLISKACCRAGRHFGGNPEIANCSEASDRFVSGNIAVLTDLREICVGHFVVCCKETKQNLQTAVPSLKSGPKTAPVQQEDNRSEEETEDENPLPEPPTEQSVLTSTKSAVQLAYTCCLNGRRAAYNLAKRCEDERDVYLNRTTRGALHTAEALVGCRMEFGRCCHGQRDTLKSTGEPRSPPRKDLATLRGLQLKQHCCRQGSIQGLAPETECAQSAREFAWRPLKRFPGRRAQCSSEYKHCCALRQEQSRRVDAIRTARKRWEQRVSTPTVATPTQTSNASFKRPLQSSRYLVEKGASEEISTVMPYQHSTKKRVHVNSRRASSEDDGTAVKSEQASTEKSPKIVMDEVTRKGTSIATPSQRSQKTRGRLNQRRASSEDDIIINVGKSSRARDMDVSSKRSSLRSVALLQSGKEVSSSKNFSSTVTPYKESMEEPVGSTFMHASKEVEESSRVSQELSEKSTKTGGRDQGAATATSANSKRVESFSSQAAGSDVRVKPPSRSERSRKAARPTAKRRRRARRRHRVARTRPGPPAQLPNDGAKPPKATPDIMDVLAPHRRPLRLCCMHGGRVDPNVFQPRSCSREADSYARGTRLTGPVRKLCREVYEHCCQAGNETHPGHDQHPGHVGVIRSPSRMSIEVSLSTEKKQGRELLRVLHH
ncbi:uncharacterized protein LOC118425117 [Branchiostoma floridae]|uniref:Uncharacterized protein LOC118425117 n=1 Tax=Branchiostoma floridae TaxID=7739 RepID=A0A9J7LV15_BRAFL|nr:uncharacterized protein LOC118425117 [Branchiostoma floridae]